jgi:hypothetical protein
VKEKNIMTVKSISSEEGKKGDGYSVSTMIQHILSPYVLVCISHGDPTYQEKRRTATLL